MVSGLAVAALWVGTGVHRIRASRVLYCIDYRQRKSRQHPGKISSFDLFYSQLLGLFWIWEGLGSGRQVWLKAKGRPTSLAWLMRGETGWGCGPAVGCLPC